MLIAVDHNEFNLLRSQTISVHGSKIKLAALADRQCDINPSGADLMGRRRNQAVQDRHLMRRCRHLHQDRLGNLGMNRNQSA